MQQVIKTNVPQGESPDWSCLCAIKLVIYARYRCRITIEVDPETGLLDLRFNAKGDVLLDLVTRLNKSKYLD